MLMFFVGLVFVYLAVRVAFSAFSDAATAHRKSIEEQQRKQSE